MSPCSTACQREEVSGRILTEEVNKVLGEMKTRVENCYATGQCNGWKNVNKTSLIGTMINVEYKPYLMNTINISALPKTAEELLKIVKDKIRYVTEILKVSLVAWCTNASGESAKMQCLLVKEMPWIVVVDCWAHQVNFD
ncbi:hypothetical protein PAXRUDRAFT_807235 [Paxillus rubicundulus Ve08.2h10]|uniref:DUF659 domain-containing protein n=1 Tax=Paxillus rubicundulus Ve08.2h10 TaxID=930991 RepID=A0A0D0EBN3_9AGAM|nr:hypothetical protein PAXRUDRAFT_807235 [Paxillus rubicundulus Ve08.2h10]